MILAWVLGSLIILISLCNTILLIILLVKFRNLYSFSEMKRMHQEVKSKLENPTSELSEFLSDLQGRGYGAVRIDPDRMMLRSPKGPK